ncbi:universal stress protein [Accumulibacter sp.]|uniref:universal stress protein n=1 Tax=Accumulibacter sp. TaxID=2053492 RepID=UPI0025CDB580|nr:universal stress protein [Accumulibacter sp.]MCM8594292.1 universal stress protein [Accumulibacter sp.]MCM8627885.1 universal stress protein [Accumulibacter sp.]MDS4048436.1 universal stress protein [Accumulibacter sp.]
MSATWLIAVDGSAHALRAVDHVIRELGSNVVRPKIQLVNVQAPLPSDVSRFLDSSVIRDYHSDAGDAALAEAITRVEAAGLACSHHVLVGEPAQTIVQFAREQKCNLIVLGARGRGSVAGILLGSVTSRVIHLTDLPVLVVK